MDRELEQIILRHQNTVLSCLFAIVRDRELAEDLLQETFVVACDRRKDLAAIRDPGAWLRTVARRIAYRALRKSRSRRLAFWAGGDVPEETPEAVDAHGPRFLEDQLLALQECRKKLSPQQQRILELFYEGRQTGDDVARSLGLNRRTVFQTLYVARKSLLECVERRLAQQEEANGREP
jgi:RNA polymerase sigma-70 factor (ECF subfamily)